MRHPEEIRFRAQQEIANLWLWAFPPVERSISFTPSSVLPDPRAAAEAARNTAWASATVAAADRILQGFLPLLGGEIEAGSSVAWRRDYHRNIETQPSYFRRIPYLDVSRAGDHKLIWEMSRHQHLVLVAQAFLLTQDPKYQAYVFRQLEHWWEENPFQRGINWASALEVAFRALSWIWIHHFLGATMPAAFRDRFLQELARHGHHLEYNLSVYFSPNTHLLGEAVALHAIGTLFPHFRRAAAWRELGRSTVVQELDKQIQQDGSHFEHSTYYHVYAVDFFVLHHLIEPLDAAGVARLRAMADFLASVTTPSGKLAFLGDDDGGRLFHPFGQRNTFARATLATCSLLLGERYFSYTEEDISDQALWWLGAASLKASTKSARQRTSTLFRSSGLAVMEDADVHVLIDAGPFGWANAGHSHSDTLSLVVHKGPAEILIDPGAYTYVGDVGERDAFRGSAAHNTVRIDGRDQADPAGPFRWLNKPAVEVLAWNTTEREDYLHAFCSYRGLRHRREIWFTKPNLLVIVDTLEGAGEHDYEQFWHAGDVVVALGAGRWRIGPVAELAVSSDGSVTNGWRSDVLGSKRPAPVIRVAGKATFPVRLVSVLRTDGNAPTPVIDENGIVVDGRVYAK